MKQVNFLAGISYALILSAPIFLAGCEGITSPFNTSSASSNYDNYDYNKANSTNGPANKGTSGSTKGKSGATTLVEPGMSTVNNPKATSTTTSTVPLDAPMVPGAAPSVGQ